MSKLFYSAGLLRLLSFTFVFGVAAFEIAEGQEPETQQRGVRDYTPKTVLKNPIRAIVAPKVVSADATTVRDNDLVIGVTVNEESRAYPINQLTGPMREIINDTLGGTAIAATW